MRIRLGPADGLDDEPRSRPERGFPGLRAGSGDSGAVPVRARRTHVPTATGRERAVEEFTAAAGDAERALGVDHPTTLTHRVNLNFWRGQAGEPAMALAELATLQPRIESVLGADHPRALRTRQQRAELLELPGENDAAATLLTSLPADMIRVQGSDHPRTHEVAEALARCGGRKAR
ncbi:hypothetical protein ACIF9R_26125 [Streptomyces sp. NPDC086080]|uniref:hypothetical protein n=1 Tax=Streptomyces sp. NPDC086080 TaxID=3365748 RepID=UPI0037D4C156